MKRLIIYLDAFGQTPQLLINHQNKYHSFFGGIMTIFLYIISIIAFGFFSMELFRKRSPSVNLSTQADEHPSKIPFYGNFEFLIGVQNSSMLVHMDETIYYAKGYIFSTIKNESGSFNIATEIDVEPCDKALKDTDTYEFVKHVNIEDYYCFSKKQLKAINDDLYINDFWNNDGFRMLQVKFYECKNTTERNNCKPQEYIDKYLKLQEISLYYIDNFVKTTNYRKPFERGMKEVFYYVSNSYTFYLTNYIHHLEVHSDDGLLFTTNHIKDSFKVDYLRDLTIYQKSDTFFAQYTMQFNNVKEIYYRKYYKLQDLAAQVGGIFKILGVIFYIFSAFNSEHGYYEYLINSFFRINKESNTEQIKVSSSANISKPPSHSTQIILSAHNEIRIRSKLKKKKISLSFIDKAFILSCFPKSAKKSNNLKYKLYYNGRFQLTTILEIKRVLKQLYYYDIIMNYMFSESDKKNSEILKPELSDNRAIPVNIKLFDDSTATAKHIIDAINKIKKLTSKEMSFG